MRLIDDDELKKELCQEWFLDIILTQQSMKTVFRMLAQKVDEQPTAYDVDKVVEQLKQNTHDMEICEEQFDMNRPYFKDVPYKMIKLEDAIKIVKAGGKDGN